MSLDGLGPHEVVLEGSYSVISPGTELAHYRGDARNGLLVHAAKGDARFYPGYAMAGTVLAAGDESGLRAGMRVLAHSPHQSLARIDTTKRVCVAIPDGLDLAVAPFARLAQVGGIMLQLSTVRPGETVAVIGLGPVGNLVAQLAQIAGYRVVAIEISRARRSLAVRSGLTEVVTPNEARDALSGSGAQLVLECSGRQAALVMATELAARYGEVMTVGAPWIPEPEVPASAITARVFEKFLTLRSGWEAQAVPNGPRRSMAECTKWVLSCLAQKLLETAPLVTDTVRFDQAPDAYRMLDTNPSEHFTYVLSWSAV
ncbi:MAG: zinc-binding alcohol dehydrogenase [Actinomycetota bacterium]|nr:zinc-binding alcohol dehydrogenase [Actinomycetota bacterium]